MKLTFVYSDADTDNERKFHQGIAQLSSCLKQADHQTSLIHIYEKITKQQYLDRLAEHAPDIVAFSSISNLFDEIKELAIWTRQQLDAPIVYGGPHATLVPDECMDTGLFDIICRGEGEEALVELCNALDKGDKITDIQNLWVKSDGQIYKNPIRPLIEDLDTLPSLDYELFNYENLVDATAFKRLVTMASRGCPYNCTYCCNHTFRELYPNKKSYVRFRSVDKVIEEIEKGLKKYSFCEQVRFFDDTLTLKKSWFREFVQKYKARIGLPYSINDRVNQVDEEIISLLKDSGCNLIAFGIESGNKEIREQIMKRGTSDEQIIKAFELCRKYGIQTNAFNILGVPGETFASIVDTVKLNAKAKPDYSYILYFHPYIGTELHSICAQKGYLTGKVFKTITEGPTLNLETITEKQTVFAWTFFRPMVRLYKRYYKLPEPMFKFMDKCTVRILSSRLFPKLTMVKLMPFCTKFAKNTRKLRKNAEENLKKIPFLYRLLRPVYRFLFVRKKKKQ